MPIDMNLDLFARRRDKRGALILGVGLTQSYPSSCVSLSFFPASTITAPRVELTHPLPTAALVCCAVKAGWESFQLACAFSGKLHIVRSCLLLPCIAWEYPVLSAVPLHLCRTSYLVCFAPELSQNI